MLVTSGSQQALDAGRPGLLDPGDRVLVEDPPTWRRSRCSSSRAPRVEPVPVDPEGLDVEAAGGARRRPRRPARLLRPAFQNPTGGTLPAARRGGLGAVAERGGPVDRRGRPVRRAPLRRASALVARRGRRRAGARDLHAVQDRRAGAAHRLRPGTRGAAPAARRWPSRRRTCTPRRSTRPRPRGGSPPVDLDAHLATRCAGEYGARRDALLAGLGAARCRPAPCTTAPRAACSSGRGSPTAGTRTCCCGRALERDVAFVPGYPFFAGPPDHATLRFSFTTHHPGEIAEGLRRLRAAWA